MTFLTALAFSTALKVERLTTEQTSVNIVPKYGLPIEHHHEKESYISQLSETLARTFPYSTRAARAAARITYTVAVSKSVISQYATNSRQNAIEKSLCTTGCTTRYYLIQTKIIVFESPTFPTAPFFYSLKITL